ncbi:hypothetical protein QBC45DRAFT_235783 [Copromyces sp. CBS 386.78]|nr:hypothetical protein QBC45DRAFT_235783 [Copromyces sp. CBS 386.78]
MADTATQPTGACDRSDDDPTSTQPAEPMDLEPTPAQTAQPAEPMDLEPTVTSAQTAQSTQPMDLDPSDPHNDDDNDSDGDPDVHPLFTTHYNILDELDKAVRDWGRRHGGYELIRGRSNNFVTDFGYTRVEFVCRTGKIRDSIAHSRSTSTAKRGYP